VLDELEREAPGVGHANALPVGGSGGTRKDVGGGNGASQWKGEGGRWARAAVRAAIEDGRWEGR